MIGKVVSGLIYLVSFYFKGFCNLCKQPNPILSRKIGASVKWFLIWSEKNIQRPTPIHAHRLHSFHIYLVNVWSFFTVYFDANETFIHHFGYVFVLERFSFHHMAPVTGRVADTD